MTDNEQKLLGRASDLIDRISKADYTVNNRDRIFIRSVLLRLIENILNKDDGIEIYETGKM